MSNSRWVLLLLLPCMAGPAAADSLSYDYVQAGYVKVDVDDTDVGIDGFGIGAAVAIGERAFLFGAYSMLESDDLDPSVAEATVELDGLEAGIGFRLPLASGTDANFTAAFVKADIRSTGSAAGLFDDDDTGHSLGVGLRHLATPALELSAGIARTEIFDDSGTALSLGALVHFGSLALAGSYTTEDDASTIQLGLRINLGAR